MLLVGLDTFISSSWRYGSRFQAPVASSAHVLVHGTGVSITPLHFYMYVCTARQSGLDVWYGLSGMDRSYLMSDIKVIFLVFRRRVLDGKPGISRETRVTSAVILMWSINTLAVLFLLQAISTRE